MLPHDEYRFANTFHVLSPAAGDLINVHFCKLMMAFRFSAKHFHRARRGRKMQEQNGIAGIV